MDERVDRFNDEAMELSKKQIDEVIASCRKRLGKPKTYTGNFVPSQQQQGQRLFTSTANTNATTNGTGNCITNAINFE